MVGTLARSRRFGRVASRAAVRNLRIWGLHLHCTLNRTRTCRAWLGVLVPYRVVER